MKKIYALSALFLAACAGGMDRFDDHHHHASFTPNVDFVANLDVWAAPHRDSFLNQLAMNYRSYAMWNAREIGDFATGELFANKAIAAFAGDTPMPEAVGNWPIHDHNMQFELNQGLDALIAALKNDAADKCPKIAAEAQAKFDCWVSATAMGQSRTAGECRDRFGRAMAVLRSPSGCDNRIVRASDRTPTDRGAPTRDQVDPIFYPDTGNLSSVANASRARDSVVIVNNVNIPDRLINPSPVMFTQNIFGDSGGIVNCVDDEECDDTPAVAAQITERPAERGAAALGEQGVSRDEFINMMMAMRQELAAIHQRLDGMPVDGDKTMIKVQQIPLEPQQHIMEEIFEIRFDFDRYEIKPEYRQIIRNLVDTANRHKNVKISVVGHTDTVGSPNYNFALGGRRAEAVRNELIKSGIPASQIIALSSGMNNLRVPTGPGVKNAENRRVRVVRETHWTDNPSPNAMTVTLEDPDNVMELYGEFRE
ncbi:MAG: OmpA family protein [Alphaproteobacteria bacterium]|nr:OmpA family protein [Alphaproteobacteria bacterium]MCL2758031.1 OmpA family protein [Alphaproteobacteria bacterium]